MSALNVVQIIGSLLVTFMYLRVVKAVIEHDTMSKSTKAIIILISGILCPAGVWAVTLFQLGIIG